jgi:hypothetical protein
VKHLVLASSLAFVLGCPKNGPRRPTPEELIGADPLPLALGASWEYRATVTQFDPETKKDVKTELSWTTSVVEAHPIQDVVSFKLKGWPSDLVGVQVGAPPATEKTILRSGDNFLWASKADGGVEGAMGWFTWPLMDGQRICPDPQVTYCWTVVLTDDGYRLTYRTGPDEESYLIMPGTGVAEYRYSNSSNARTVVARLVEYKAGKKGAMSTAAPVTPSGN